MAKEFPRSPGWAVLLVDDEPDVRRSIERALEAGIPDIRIHEAATGLEALQTLDQHRIDLIISDQRMPEMEGVEFLTIAAKLRPQVPRILLTGFADLRVAFRAVNGGHVNAFLQKPTSNQDLVDAVLRLLQKAEAEVGRQREFARSLDLVDRPRVAYRGPLGQGERSSDE